MEVPFDQPRGQTLQSDLRAISHALWRKAWFVALITVLTTGAGIAYIARSPRIFSSTSTVEVEAEQQRIINEDRPRPEERGEEVLKTLEQNLRNPALLLRLGRHPLLTGEASFRREVPASTSEARIEQILSGKITVRVRPGTRLIDVTAEDESPAVAQKLSRLLLEEFITSTAESRALVSRTSHEYIREEAERLKLALAKSEEALQRYKEQSRAVSLEEKQNIIVERLRELNAKVTTAKAERLKIEADVAQLQQLADEPPSRWLMLASVASMPEIADLQRRIGIKENEIATLSLRYLPAHPRHLEATSSLAELKSKLDDALRRSAGLLGTALEAARANETKLEEALHTQEALALDLSQTAIPYQTLAREVDANRALYASLLARLKESDIGQTVSPYAVRVVSPALLPERPIKPRKSLILVLAFGAGLALSTTLVLALHLLDQSVRTVDQAERLFSLPVLGAIPRVRKLTLRATPRALLDRPHTALAESFQDLRTTLLVGHKTTAAPKVVLFASAAPGEGKTFCAINYAVALAQQGFRTLLIDADLRLPSVGRAFFDGDQARGLSDVLAGRSTVGDATFATDLGSLSVLPAGPPIANASALIGGADLAAIIGSARASFDRVVVDTAPVHAVSDTMFLTPHVDAICLVVRAGRTPASVSLRALHKLRQSGARVAGIILNGLPREGGNYYHYHAAGYGGAEVYGGRAGARG